MIKNLITGGSGFIGSHLAELLLARGEEVTIIDDLSTGAIRNLDACRIHPNLKVHIASIGDIPLMSELVDRADRIWHLAAAVGVRLILEKPVHTIETNIRGTEIVLSLAAKKSKPVLVTSTSEVYGKSSKVPFAEGDDLVFGSTTRPRWAYACSKAIDEFLALAYYNERKTPVIIVRLFNTVGPRQTGQYGMVIPRFVMQALRNDPITVYGDGTQTRAFGHVDDIIGGLVQLMNTPAAVGEVFNVGNDQEISILELAELIVEETGSQSRVELVPFEKAYDENFEDLARRVPDLTKIKSFIPYEPKNNIRDIVRQVIQYHKTNEGI